MQSKPEQVREKIVEGMLQKRFFAESVLSEQVWIHDSAKTVGQALEEAGVEVLEFGRASARGVSVQTTTGRARPPRRARPRSSASC